MDGGVTDTWPTQPAITQAVNRRHGGRLCLPLYSVDPSLFEGRNGIPRFKFTRQVWSRVLYCTAVLYRGACVWGAWARNVSIGRGTRRFRSQKRGEGYVRRVRITDPLPQTVVVHARDTWQHTYRYTEFPVPPATKKPSFRTSRTSRPHAIICRRAAEHGSGFMILATHPPTNQQGEPARYLTRYQRDITRLPARH
jgi:hypothetical protein